MKKPDETQFIDAEDHSYLQRDQQFSHQALVMDCMRKCVEAGSHELRSGWWNRKVDKMGNVTMQYIEDTRLKFVESVRSCQMVMVCDYDPEAERKIKFLNDKLRKKKIELLREQWTWFSSLNPHQRMNVEKQYGKTIPKAFNENFSWWTIFVHYELRIHRKIFEELTRLSKRVGFYEGKRLTQ